MILYKYKQDSSLTRSIFYDNKIWLSKPSELNDPFECSIKGIDEKIINNLIRTIAAWKVHDFINLVDNFILGTEGNLFDLSKKEAEIFIHGFKEIKSLKLAFEQMNIFYTEKSKIPILDIKLTRVLLLEQLSEVGIFSMSETAANQLLWSHYADNSRGLAIGIYFDWFFINDFQTVLGKSYDPIFGPLICKVNYADEPTEITGKEGNYSIEIVKNEFNQDVEVYKLNLNEPTILKSITTKPSCWSYEKEWRYIDTKSGYFDLTGKIISITFGLNCPLHVRKEYVDMISSMNAELKYYEIIKSKDSNEFVRVPYQLH